MSLSKVVTMTVQKLLQTKILPNFETDRWPKEQTHRIRMNESQVVQDTSSRTESGVRMLKARS